MNSLGALTINSQPRVNGSLSSDPYVGWVGCGIEFGFGVYFTLQPSCSS